MSSVQSINQPAQSARLGLPVASCPHCTALQHAHARMHVGTSKTAARQAVRQAGEPRLHCSSWSGAMSTAASSTASQLWCEALGGPPSLPPSLSLWPDTSTQPLEPRRRPDYSTHTGPLESIALELRLSYSEISKYYSALGIPSQQNLYIEISRELRQNVQVLQCSTFSTAERTFQFYRACLTDQKMD